MLDHSLIYIFLACIIGFLMTWGVGANDLANIMSTTMGSKAVTVRQAVIIAIVFEFAGAFFGSNDVSNTLRNSIINTNLLCHDPYILVDSMLAVLFAGSTWMLIASFLGLPVSITNAIVGSLVGLAVAVLGIHAIYWNQVRWIALSWITSPILAGIVSYALFRSVQRLILTTVNPLQNTRRFLPFYFFLVGIILSFMIVVKGLKHFDIILNFWSEFLVVTLTALGITLIGLVFSTRINLAPDPTGRDRFAPIEKLFSVLMAFTACAMVFAHGSNDVAIAVGPMSAIIDIVLHNLNTNGTSSTSNWIILLGCTGVLTGLAMYGRKVIATVGSGITTLTPSRAFAATLAAAATVIFSTSTGIPVSATQTLVGGVMGVGLARGIGALNLNVVRNILLSWLVTIPAASVLAIIYFYIIRDLFSA